MSTKNAYKGEGLDGSDRLQALLREYFSALYGAIRPDPPSGRTTVHSFTVMRSDEGGWLVVARGLSGDDGTPVVAFGNGSSPWEALWAVNKSINANKFKVDTKGRK